MKLSLFSAAPALLLASSAAFAQAPAVAPTPTPAPAAVPDAPAAASAPAPAPIDITTPALAPTPAAPPAEVLPTKPEETALAPKLGLLKDGWWQPGANLQFWVFGANQAGENQSTLRIRRAELKLKGELIPKLIGFNVMIDPARALDNNKKTLTTSDGVTTVAVDNQGAVSILGDFVLTVMSDVADVSVGQFKIPVSYEGSGSASKLLFPERAVVSRTYGDARDMGIKIEKKLGKHFYYYAGVFNGEGQNKLDTNKQKDLAGRIEVYPINGMMVGFVGYAGVNDRSSVATTKDRLEADFRFDLAHLLVQAEYIHGWDGATGQTKPRREGAGVYGTIGYTLFDKLQPLVRIGHYDPDVTRNLPGSNEHTNLTTTDEVTTYELGLNYYLLGDNAKLQAAWSRFVYKDQPNRGELIIAAQASF
jgi:hypothetical protein